MRTVLARLGKTGRIAAGLGLVAAVLLLWWLGTLVYALSLPSPAATSAQAEEKQRLAELQEKYKKQIAQFDGRTVFYVPAAPDAKAEVEEEPAADPNAPPPLPSSYGGPGIIGMVNDTVWFSDGARVKVGESSGDIKVVKLNAPWDATINWKGADFTVKFFERDGVVLAKNAAASTSGSAIDPTYTPPPKPPKPDPAKPDPAKPDPANPDPGKPGESPPPAGGDGGPPPPSPSPSPAPEPAAPPIEPK